MTAIIVYVSLLSTCNEYESSLMFFPLSKFQYVDFFLWLFVLRDHVEMESSEVQIIQMYYLF